MLEEWRNRLQKDLGAEEPLGVEGQENFSILFDDVTVQVRAAPPGFQLLATLGPVPADEQEILFAKLLQGNLFFQATAGATLALDQTGSRVVMQQLHPSKCTYSDFKAIFEDFLNMIDFWKKEMYEHSKNPTANF